MTAGQHVLITREGAVARRGELILQTERTVTLKTPFGTETWPLNGPQGFRVEPEQAIK